MGSQAELWRRVVLLVGISWSREGLWAQEVTEALSPGQRQGLIDFYNALDGDHWVHREGWKNAEGEFNPPGTEDGWHGVDVGWVGESVPGEPPSVVSLTFSDNQLRGSVQALLDPFPDLVSLTFLREAALVGPIPNLLGCSELMHISFVECGLEGGLPTTSNGLVALPLHLQELSLRGCPLQLDWNQLLAMADLYRLNSLDLQDIPLGGSLPDLATVFPSLRVLDLGNTGLSGPLPARLPAGMSQLDLSGNALQGGLPATWGEATDLLILWLQGNKLAGELPASLMALENLAAGGGFNINWNALFTEDPALWSFLVDKSGSLYLPDGTFLGDWRERQCTAPVQANGWPTGDGRLRIAWSEAPNPWQDAFYVVEHSTDGSVWTELLRTTDRTVTETFIPLDDRRVHDYFRVSTHARPFSMNANEVASFPRQGRHDNALFYDNFESQLPWQLSGDFAVGSPQAGNGAPTAWDGIAILGTNLAGPHLDGQPCGQASAVSPSFSCLGKQHVKLAFRSFSQFDAWSGDGGSVEVSVDNGPWQLLERLVDAVEQGWERHWLNLSPVVDNHEQVRLRFTYSSDNALALDGWNLDDVLVLDRPPMSGVFSVDPRGGGDNTFATLGAAFEFCNARDLAGPTLFEVARDGVFEEELEPLFVKGASERVLTFASSGGGDNPVVRSTGGAGLRDGVLTLRGARFVQIVGLDLEPGPGVEFGVQVLNRASDEGCADLLFSDLTIRGGGQAGMMVTSRHAPTTSGGANNRIALERVAVAGAPSGLVFDNPWNTPHLDVDNRVQACTLVGGDSGEWGRGVVAQGQNGLKVEACEIRDLRGLVATGMDLRGANLLVAGNRIHGLDGDLRVSGILAEGAKICNNMVALEDLGEGVEIVGVALRDGYASWCDFNSIRVQGGAQSTSDCLVLSESTACRVSNNILANLTPAQGEGWHHAALSVVGTPYFTNTASPCDANLIHVPTGAGGGVGWNRYLASPLVDLDAWRTETGVDLLSGQGDPNFVSATDLHVRPGQATPAEAAGHWLQGSASYPWLSTDLDGEVRHLSTPDQGADEGDFATPSELPWEAYALAPQPGERGVELRPTLRASWSWDGTHPVLWTEFYLGTDSSAVAECAPASRVLADGSPHSEWRPAMALEESTRYFWQVRTCNWTGCTKGGVWAFTTESLVRAFPFCESFDAQVPPLGWSGRLNQAFDGGLNGNNLQPTWGMGWFSTSSEGEVYAGSGAARIHSWMMPAYYWLLSPMLELPAGGLATFHLRFEHSAFQPTELHLLGDTGGGWDILRSWDGAEDSCGLSVMQEVALPASGTLRLAFVYNAAAQGTPVSLDELCVATARLAAPVLEVHPGPADLLQLEWTTVPGTAAYRVEFASEAGGPWQILQSVTPGTQSLEVQALAPRRFYRVVASDATTRP